MSLNNKRYQNQSNIPELNRVNSGPGTSHERVISPRAKVGLKLKKDIERRISVDLKFK